MVTTSAPLRDTVTPQNCVGSLGGAADAARDMGKIQYALTHGWNDWYLQRVIYTESHDEVANGQEICG